MRHGRQGRGRRRWLAALPLLALAGLAGTRAPARRHVVAIRAMAYHPETLAVARGDTVVWVNRDVVGHTATATGRPRWETALLAPGDTGRIVATVPGTAPYVCALHPTMHGVLVIR